MKNKYKNKGGEEGKGEGDIIFCIKNPINCFELLINSIYVYISGKKWNVLARTLTMEADTGGILLPNSKILFKSIGQSVIS